MRFLQSFTTTSRVRRLVALGLVAALALSTAAAYAQQMFVVPSVSGWNTGGRYPSGSSVCPVVDWQFGWAYQYYDDRVSSPKQLWFDYSDVYGGTPSNASLEWQRMVVADGLNYGNTGVYFPPSYWAFWRDWTVWPQRSFGYDSTHDVYIETNFGIGTGLCSQWSILAFDH